MEDHIRRGQPPPDSIQNAPVLAEGLGLYYTAFMDLTTCRQLGEMPGPISWLTIQKYCEVHQLEGEQAEDMHYYVSRMDYAYLEHKRKQQESKTKQLEARAKSKAKQPRRRK